jgi:hypothetical protein
VRCEFGAVAEPHDAGGTSGLQPSDLAGRQHLRAELLCLPAGTVGELGTGHAVGETEVVLDP